jgi:pyrimidine-nucleoside phosphorylase
MNFLKVIESKRDGVELTPAEIREIIARHSSGELPDYQMAAFLMAVYFRGLSTAETTVLTLAMRDSGEMLAFPADPRPLVDKHSTGGVGDKVSLPLAPLLACLGFRVPMVSGRGLGITGGTLDKLDSIPGFQTSLKVARIVEIVQETGCVICGQTERMVPADKALYSLRDVTGTVPSIPLIVASILSKKLAEGLGALVLDVKFGGAAFMQTLEQARELGQAMVNLGNQCGVSTRALITNMDAPLGRAAGNWLEVKEAVACLNPTPAKTQSSRHASDLLELVLTCASHLLVQTKQAKSFETARGRAEDCLASGEPRRKWDEMLAAQGADLEAFRRKLELDYSAPAMAQLSAPSSGYISRCDGRAIGEVIRDLGGGRLSKDSTINYDVGVDRLAKPGEPVNVGDILARVHAATTSEAQNALARLQSAIDISSEAPKPRSLIAETIIPDSASANRQAPGV